MKYLKLFEGGKPKFEINDYVKIIVDKLRIGPISIENREKNIIFRVSRVFPTLIDLNKYYITDLNDINTVYTLSVFEDEIRLVPDYELDAIKYNL